MTLRSSRRNSNLNTNLHDDIVLDKFNCRVVLEDINIPNRDLVNDSISDIDCGDGSAVHVKRCGSKRCQFQNKFHHLIKFIALLQIGSITALCLMVQHI